MFNTINSLLEKNFLKNDKILTLIFPDKPDECYTFQEIYYQSLKWLNYYTSKSLHKNDKIIIILKHSIDLYTSYIGAIMGGFIPSYFPYPSNKYSISLYSENILKLVSNIQTNTIVTYTELKNYFDKIFTNQTILSFELDESYNNNPDFVKHIPNENEIAFIQFSSGTTGIKKGVEISHKSLILQIEAYYKTLDIRNDDIIVGFYYK